MIQFTSIPGPAKATSKGIGISIAAGDDLPVDVETFELDGE